MLLWIHQVRSRDLCTDLFKVPLGVHSSQPHCLRHKEMGPSGKGETQDNQHLFMAAGGCRNPYLSWPAYVCLRHGAFLSGCAPLAFVFLDLPTRQLVDPLPFSLESQDSSYRVLPRGGKARGLGEGEAMY